MPLTKIQKNNILQAIADTINAAGPLATKDNQIATYTSFINMHPNFKELYEKRRDLYFDDKNWDAAINDCNILIALEPNSIAYNKRGNAWNRKASEHGNKKEYDLAIEFSNKAIENCTAALAIDPNYQVAKNNLAVSYVNKRVNYEKKNDIEAGYNSLKEAMKINCDADLKEKITKDFQRIEKLYNESRISASSASEAVASSSSKVRKRAREVEVTEARELPALESFSNIAASAGEEIRIKQESVEAIPAMDIDELQITQAIIDPISRLAQVVVKQEPIESATDISSSNWKNAVQSQSSSAASSASSTSSFAARFEEQRAAKKQKTIKK